MFQSVQNGGSTSNPVASPSANLAGIHFACHFFTSLFSPLTLIPWIIDSGASQYMTYQKHLLHNITVLSPPILVSLPNSSKVKVHYIRSIFLTPKFELHHVLFVPCFSSNLLSVYQLCYQFNCDLLFNKFGCAIQVPSKKRDQIFGKAASGLYVLKDNTRQLESRSIKPHTPVSSLSNVASKSCSPMPSSKYESVCPKSLYPGSVHPVYQGQSNDIMNKIVSISHVSVMDKLWHSRLGHLPFTAIKHIKDIPITFSD